MKNLHRTGTILLPAILTVASLAACKSTRVETQEVMLSAEIASDQAPDWVAGKIESQAGHIAFVGRGGGLNVLDERGAFDEALDHAREQVAAYVTTEVVRRASYQDASALGRLIPHPGGDAGLDPQMLTCATWASNVVVGGVAASDQHWERWEVSRPRVEGGLLDNGSYSPTFRRYKCWVLTQVDQATLDEYVTATMQLMDQGQDIALLEAQVAAGRQDLLAFEEELRANLHELQDLRERVHYGRRFRLVGPYEGLSYREARTFGHPDWRTTDLTTRTRLVPLPAPAEEACELYGSAHDL